MDNKWEQDGFKAALARLAYSAERRAEEYGPTDWVFTDKAQIEAYITTLEQEIARLRQIEAAYEIMTTRKIPKGSWPGHPTTPIGRSSISEEYCGICDTFGHIASIPHRGYEEV